MMFGRSEHPPESEVVDFDHESVGIKCKFCSRLDVIFPLDHHDECIERMEYRLMERSSFKSISRK